MSTFAMHSLIVRDIVLALGGEWTMREPESPHWPHHISRPDGADLWVTLDGGRDKGRIVVEGRLTRPLYDHKPYDATLPDITVSNSKSPAEIANAIERRLLPRLLPIVEAATASKKAMDEADARREAMRVSILEALGPVCRQNRDGINVYLDGLYGDIEVRHGEAFVTLHISDEAIAKRFAAWLAEIKA